MNIGPAGPGGGKTYFALLDGQTISEPLRMEHVARFRR